MLTNASPKRCTSNPRSGKHAVVDISNPSRCNSNALSRSSSSDWLLLAVRSQLRPNSASFPRVRPLSESCTSRAVSCSKSTITCQPSGKRSGRAMASPSRVSSTRVSARQNSVSARKHVSRLRRFVAIVFTATALLSCLLCGGSSRSSFGHPMPCRHVLRSRGQNGRRMRQRFPRARSLYLRAACPECSQPSRIPGAGHPAGVRRAAGKP